MARDLHRSLREAWIVDAVRTPIGRYGGALAAVRPDDLAAIVIRAIVDRTGVDPATIEDVVLGCANGAGEDNRNVARMALLLAGLPVEVAGQTVNRLCGSGLQAVNSAAHAIGAGDGEVFVAGGVESMTRAPYVMLKADGPWDRGPRAVEDTTLGWRFVNPRMREAYPPISLGETAECVAEQWSVSRERQDAFALESQRRAVAAIEAGRFDGQLVPVTVPGRKGAVTVVDRDEHPRADTSAEALAGLKPAFKPGGTVTAGNSSGINDGAAALLLVEAERARAMGLRPMARVVATAVAGVHPDVMGIGPVPAVRKVARAGRPRDRRPRRRRDQRGVRQPVGRVHGRARSRSGPGQPQRRRDRARPPARGVGGAARHDGRPRARADRWPVRPRDDVHRRRPGDRDGRGAARGVARRRRDARGRRRSPGSPNVPPARTGCWTKSVAVRTIGCVHGPLGPGTRDPRRVPLMIDAQPTIVSLTDAAATKLRELTKEEPNPEIGLRVYVYSGGCSGYRYGMMLEDAPTSDDNVLSANGVRVYIDTEQRPAHPGQPDRLRRHPHGRGVHRQQPERGLRLRLRLELPDGGRRRPGSELLPLDTLGASSGRRTRGTTPPGQPAASSCPIGGG